MATHFGGTAAERRALDAFITLSRASESVMSRLRVSLAARGLSAGQLGVLEALLHLGPLVQRDLAGRLLRSPANVTALIDALEERRLVERVRADDRRAFNVRLTRTGRSLIEAVFPSHVTEIVTVFSTLTAAEQRDLARLCRKLGLGATGDGRGKPGKEPGHDPATKGR